MTPKEYLDRYTYLSFPSPWGDEMISAGLYYYGSGWDSRNGVSGAGKFVHAECQAFIRALRVTHHGNANTPCGKTFYLADTDSKMEATEPFYADTITHAFDGKGSPDEIIDVLRLAMVIGRIGSPGDRDSAGAMCAAPTAKDYADRFMTLDCNAFVGNFVGGNPSAHISDYAQPQRARRSAAEVKPGDVIVTHCAAAPYEHVGLIDYFQPVGGTALVQIAEWGWFGGQEMHYNADPKPQTITTGPESKFGIGWAVQSNVRPVPSFRYIFAPPGENEPWGWS